MSLTSYRAAPPRGGVAAAWVVEGGRLGEGGTVGGGMVGGPGGDLLSHVLRRSTMGAAGFHGRVRNGVGWGTRAIGHQVEQPPPRPAAARPRAGGARRRRAGRAAQAWVVPARSAWALGRMRLSLLGVEVDRAIRTGQLRASPRFHTRPIDVVVYHGSDGETWFCGGFPA